MSLMISPVRRAPRRADRAPCARAARGGRCSCRCPSFSRYEVAGRTTSANSAVSVRKMSCTTRNSSAAQRLADLVDVRVRQERVLAHHVHARERRRASAAADDLGHRQAALGSSSRPQASSKLLPDAGAVDRLVVGIEHRDQARVGGALHVVLAAQRVQAGARPADVAGDQAQRDQAARVVGAGACAGEMPMPQKMTRGSGLAPQPRDLADASRRRRRRSAPARSGGYCSTSLGQRLEVRRCACATNSWSTRPSRMITCMTPL